MMENYIAAMFCRSVWVPPRPFNPQRSRRLTVRGPRFEVSNIQHSTKGRLDDV